MAANETSVTFYQGTQAEYDAASTKDVNGIYFLSDTKSIYKGNVKYGGGGDVNIATPTTPGIIKPGSSFDIAGDGTLTLYSAMNITSFGNNVNNVEKGSQVASVTLSWGTNKTPSQLSLVQGSTAIPVAVTDKSKTITPSPAISTTTKFTLTATDARNATSSKDTWISFLDGRYYGASAVNDAANVNSTFVNGLTKQLASSAATSFTVTAGAGQYIFFAIPAAWGKPRFFVGGFEGGFDTFKTFDHTNAQGYTTSYTVYKSSNANLGATTVEVKA